MKLTIVLMAVILMGGCAENQEISRALNGSSAREVAQAKAVVQSPVEVKPTPAPVTTTVPVEPVCLDVRIVYFFAEEILAVKGMPYASVKLSWFIENAEESRTRLDAGWVASTGHAWVQVPVGVEIPFRLVAHGTNGSVDIRLIQVLAE
jgi:hypothetical protein